MTCLTRRILPILSGGQNRLLCRTYARQLPRPPPPTEPPTVTTFSDTSKPRPYYGRGPQPLDLPTLQKRWPFILALSVAGSTAWAGFLFFVMNQEKISSSVVQQIMRTVKENEELREVLGDAIRPEPTWYLNGDPWIHGTINMMQGSVDLSFRLKGNKGSGTLYFTSIRKNKGEPFTQLRFKVIADTNETVHLPGFSYQPPSRREYDKK